MDSLRVLYDFSEKQDQWDTMYSEMHELFCYLGATENFNMTFRLLGPFLPSRRIYLSEGLNNNNFTQNDLRNIFLGNTQTIEKINSVVDNKLVKYQKNEEINPNPFRRIVEKKDRIEDKLRLLKFFLQRVQDIRAWKPCLLVNAMVIKSHNPDEIGNIKILIISPNIMTKLKQYCIDRFGYTTIKINGLNSYDLIMSTNRRMYPNSPDVRKAEFGTYVEDQVSLSESPYLLSRTTIDSIMSNGILDLNKVIKLHNQKRLVKMFGYFFRVCGSLRASEEMMKSIADEAKEIEEKAQFSSVLDLDKKYIPKEAFEDVEEITNPVMDMEL